MTSKSGLPVMTFVSYAHDDDELVDTFIQELRKISDEFGFWLDNDQISAGSDFATEIARAIDACRVGLILLSPKYLESKWVPEHELPLLRAGYDKRGMKLVPVVLRECTWKEAGSVRAITRDLHVFEQGRRPLFSEQGCLDSDVVLSLAEQLLPAIRDAGEVRTAMLRHFRGFAQTLKDTSVSVLAAQDELNEVQLTQPMIDLLEESAESLNLQKVSCFKQVHARSVGTPDISVVMEGNLLAGHVELNAPGKGSNPRDFSGGHDTAQFKYYSALPNLLCTDGRSFSLWRDGELVGKRVAFYGNPLVDGENAVQDGDGDYLEPLLRSFLEWTPTTLRNPEKLAKLLAPSSRYLCEAVEGVLKRGDTALSSLKNDWCTYLTPDATDRDFADAYAQTVTFGLLLARLAGARNLGSRDEIASALGVAHPLLATAIRNALDPDLRSKNDLGDLGPPLDILIRFLEVVEPAQLTDERDLWIHFYEDYLAAYDPKLRSARGVYYTPKEVVEAQVRLVTELLQERFDCRLGFADDKVTTLDPACGTGTYLIEVLNEIEKETEAVSGRGAVPRKVVEAAKRIYGFEILVGSYTVAHLNLARKFASVTPENTSGPPVQVYLTDTLESPVALPPGHLPLPYQDLGEEHERALKVKADASILVCIGNPPYDRENQETASSTRRKGGWVRYGDAGSKEKPILEDFLAPLRDSGGGGHAKNLYNDYVYFWRWALWKITKTNTVQLSTSTQICGGCSG